MSDTVLCERRGAVAVLTLNRPEKLNAVSPAMGDALARRLTDADADPDVRAVVLTGAGRGFCAGADLAALAGDLAALRERLHRAGRQPVLATELRTPVVAAVNGPAVGIGLTYVLACDVRFAAPEATLCTGFAALGLVAEHGQAWLLQRLVGLGAAADLLLSARTVDAYEAARLGLVAPVVEARPVLDVALDYADALVARCSPWSMATIKAQLRADAARGLGAAVDDAVDRLLDALTRPDVVEAVTARAQRRTPEFPHLAPPAEPRQPAPPPPGPPA